MYFDIAEVTVSIWLLVSWGILVGFVFSTVGAAGGILASVGLISAFGLQNPNLIKPMAQAMTLVTPLIAVPLYIKQCRVIYSLALLMGIGGIAGALIGSYFSVRYLSDMHIFKPIFALMVFFIAAQIAWQLLRRSPETTQLTRAMRAAENFEQHVQGGGSLCDSGVKCIHASAGQIVIEIGEQQFKYNPLLPLLTGMGIAMLSSALGVGGGFLLVPFMSIILRLPMFVIAGTSALAIAIHSITSISNYVHLGIKLDYTMLSILLVGIAVGSATGPWLSKYIPENGLRAFLCVILILIGLRYTGLF